MLNLEVWKHKQAFHQGRGWKAGSKSWRQSGGWEGLVTADDGQELYCLDDHFSYFTSPRVELACSTAEAESRIKQANCLVLGNWPDSVAWSLHRDGWYLTRYHTPPLAKL
eukprot:1161932-Pelagomonas_calceolata.AAC.17